MAGSQLAVERYKEKAIKDYRDAPVGPKENPHQTPKPFSQVLSEKVQCYSKTCMVNGTVVPACFKTFIVRQEQ